MFQFVRPCVCSLLVALLGAAAAAAAPMQDGEWSPDFDRPGLVGRVFATEPWGDDLLVGGASFQADGEYLDHVVRWDGHRWHGMGTVGGTVRTLAIYQGQPVIGGDFWSADGRDVFSIARWDGASWQPLRGGVKRFGIPGVVFDLEVVGDDLYVVGEFDEAGAKSLQGIARWDGSRWRDVGGGLGGAYPVVGWSVLSASDGRLYVGGEFDQAGGVAARNVAVFDGTGWQPLSSGIGHGVYVLHEHRGLVYAGGPFGEAGGRAAACVASWDGTDWAPLGSGIPDWDISVSVYSMASYDDQLHVGGNFVSAGGVFASRVARWDGLAWSGVGGVAGSDLKTTAIHMSVHQGELVVGGEFVYAGTQLGWGKVEVSTCIARFDGSEWKAFSLGNGLSGAVRKAVAWNGGIAAVGMFREAGDELSSTVAFLKDGEWHFLGVCNHNVWDATVFEGDLVITGDFSQVDGQSISGVARYDGVSWSGFGGGAGGGALAVYRGQLHAGGLGALRRWTGTTWESFGTSVSGFVYDMHVHEDVLYVGGSLGGSGLHNLLAWDGTRMFSPGGVGPDDTVVALNSFGGELIAGGEFDSVGGVAASRIAAFDGNSWREFGGGFSGNTVYCLDVFQGKLHASGHLILYGQDPDKYLARWNGLSWEPLGTGLQGAVFSFLPDEAKGRLYMGGSFHGTGEVPAFNFGAWETQPRASWSRYGQGHPGTHGVPALTASAPPVLGTSTTVEVENSSGAPTVGLMAVGLSPAAEPGPWGGELLVLPTWWRSLALPALGLSLGYGVPEDPALLGVAVYAQVLQGDAGASQGIASTAGLELRFGR